MEVRSILQPHVQIGWNWQLGGNTAGFTWSRGASPPYHSGSSLAYLPIPRKTSSWPLRTKPSWSCVKPCFWLVRSRKSNAWSKSLAHVCSARISHWFIAYHNNCRAFIQLFQDIILYGFSTFLPSILRLDLGYSTLQAQYLSVPVYLLGGISFFVSRLLRDANNWKGTVMVDWQITVQTAAVLGDKWKVRGTVRGSVDMRVASLLLNTFLRSSSLSTFSLW